MDMNRRKARQYLQKDEDGEIDMEGLDELPVVSLDDALKHYCQTPNARAWTILKECNAELNGLKFAFLATQGSPTPVVIYSSTGDLIAQYEQNEGGTIGSTVAGHVAAICINSDIQRAIATDHTRKTTETQRGLKADVFIHADNVTAVGSFYAVIEFRDRLKMLTNGCYEYPDNEYCIQVVYDKDRTEIDDGIEDAMLPDAREVQERLAERATTYDFVATCVGEGHLVNTSQRLLGHQVGTHTGRAQFLQTEARFHRRVVETLLTMPRLDWALMHYLYQNSLKHKYHFILTGVPPRQYGKKFTQDIDNTARQVYERLMDRAAHSSTGPSAPQRLNQAAVQMMQMPIRHGGMDTANNEQFYDDGNYLVAICAVLELLENTKPTIADELKHFIMRSAGIQIMLDACKRRLETLPAKTKKLLRARLPSTTEQLVKATGRHRYTPQRLARTLRQIGDGYRLQKMNTRTILTGRTAGAPQASPDVRVIYARAARMEHTNGNAALWTSPGHDTTRITTAGLIVALATYFGTPIPGMHGIEGHVCKCSDRMTGTAIDSDHLATCNSVGQSTVHNAVRDMLAKIYKLYPNSATTWLATEPRTDAFFNHVAARRGPDLKITIGGEIVIIDVSGIRDSTWTQLSGYGRNGALSRLQYNNTQHAIAPPPRSITTPTEERERTKHNSADAKWTAKHMGTYTAGTFVHSGGLSAEFGRLIERTIGRTDGASPELQDRSIRTHVALAKQAVQATIVNTHGATVMANQKKAYDRLGRNDEMIGWWNAEDTATVPLVAWDLGEYSTAAGLAIIDAELEPRTPVGSSDDDEEEDDDGREYEERTKGDTTAGNGYSQSSAQTASEWTRVTGSTVRGPRFSSASGKSASTGVRNKGSANGHGGAAGTGNKKGGSGGRVGR